MGPRWRRGWRRYLRRSVKVLIFYTYYRDDSLTMSLRKCRDCLALKSLDGFHICNIVGDKKYYRRKCKDCHRQQLRDNAKRHYVKNKPEIMRKAKLRERRKRKDPAYRLRSNISRSIRGALTKVGSSKGNRSFFQYVNYTLEELKTHFESHFESWMSWANYGMYEEGG